MSLILDDSLKTYKHRENLKKQIKESKYISKVEAKTTLSYKDGLFKVNSSVFPGVYCNFLSERFLKEVRQSFSRSEGVYSFLKPLARNKKIKICDLTVGMGKDLFKFILAGHEVVGYERNPIFYHLVLNGIERFKAFEKLEELERFFKVKEFKVDVRFGDAVPEVEKYDLAYFDPMFSDVSKKAAPKKNMQALKALVKASEKKDKLKTLKLWKKHSKYLVYKCSRKAKDFPMRVLKEIKGKGFSYLVL